MSWNIVPECISSVILCIIWVYSRKGNPIPSLKNRLFQTCLSVTFSAMLSNIFSTLLIYTLSAQTLFLTWAVTLIYFILTPLMGYVYFLYTFFGIYENHPKKWNLALLLSSPAILYVGMVLLDPLFSSLFHVSLEQGYEQGPLRIVTYLVFYLYCVAGMLLVLLRGQHLDLVLRAVYISFPLLAALVIVIQLFFPEIILSGSAATCSMLIIYLFLQNKQISIDYLTNLPKRQEFLNMLELKLKRKNPVCFTAVILSLKDFKAVNDTYGQHNGDAFLVAVSRYLKKEFLPREGELYRYSGDEFALLLDNLQEHEAREIAARLLARMTLPWETKECTGLLSAGVGIVSYPDSAQQLEDLINGIEFSVFLAKRRNPQNMTYYCNADTLTQIRRKKTISSLLKEYLQKGLFEVYYQPVFSVERNGFYSAEALLRMNSTSLGNLSPGEFIPIAESSGLIIELTYWVLDKVCQDIRALLESGIAVESVNVNFSTIQFTQKNLVEQVTSIIRRNHIPLSCIKIEITESALAENPETVAAFATQMQQLGVRIGLDDFGTGYSNLTSVIQLPLDVVKLDKSLVWAAMDHHTSAVVVQNLTRAFQQLGMTVLAEGVETQEQSDFMVSCGCDQIQGFLYARPMPQKDFLPFMKSGGEFVLKIG